MGAPPLPVGALLAPGTIGGSASIPQERRVAEPGSSEGEDPSVDPWPALGTLLPAVPGADGHPAGVHPVRLAAEPGVEAGELVGGTPDSVPGSRPWRHGMVGSSGAPCSGRGSTADPPPDRGDPPMPRTLHRLLLLGVIGGLLLAGTSAGLALAASPTLSAPQAPPTPLATVHRANSLGQPSQVVGAPQGLPGAELPAHWQDHGTWAPALSARGMATTQLALFLGPTAGWLTCSYAPNGLLITGRPMTYRCDGTPGSAAGAIMLVAPLVHTATGWWETAATNSGRDHQTYQALRLARLAWASNGHPWWMTLTRARVRVLPPPTVRLRPASQQVSVGHRVGITVTGSDWPAGSYAVLWDLRDNVSLTPTPRSRCMDPCQWMVSSPGGSESSGTWRFTVFLHARSGARLATATQPVTVTWGSPTPTATPTPATPSVGLRPGVQQVSAGHPAGLTVTGANWPSGAYAELWDMTDNINTTPTRSDQCTAPECQWMVPAYPAGTYQFAVYLHAASGTLLAHTTQTAQVTWVGSMPTPGPTPQATPTPTPQATPTPTPTPTPGGSTLVNDNPNWSGYTVQPGPYTYVAGTFTVPSLYTTPGASAVSTWVGIDGAYPDTTLIQAGVNESYDPSVSTTTFNITPWWEILPAPETPIDSMTVSVGDQITVAIGQVSGSTWGITITDDTTGASFTTDQFYTAPLSSAEWIVEAPTDGTTLQIDTLAQYTPAVTFTTLRMSGTEATLTDDVMVQNGVQVSTPSPLSSAGFAVAYGSVAPPGP